MKGRLFGFVRACAGIEGGLGRGRRSDGRHRRVQIHRDAPNPPSLPPPLASGRRIRQRLRHPHQLPPPNRVLEPRQRRLRRQRRARHRIPTHRKLHRRIARKTRRVVAVRGAAGQSRTPAAEADPESCAEPSTPAGRPTDTTPATRSGPAPRPPPSRAQSRRSRSNANGRTVPPPTGAAAPGTERPACRHRPTCTDPLACATGWRNNHFRTAKGLCTLHPMNNPG